MTDPAQIARGLSKAQRRLLCSLDAIAFRDWKALSVNVRTRNKLAVLGLTEMMQGTITLYFMRRLSPLGLAVRDELEKMDG